MKTIAIYPGRFQPFGPHHKQAFEWLQNQFGKSNTFIVTSNKTEDSRSPLTFSEKQEIMTNSGVSPSQIIQVKNPYRAEELLNQYDPESTAVVFMYGEKDAGRLSYTKKDGSPGYFQKYQGETDLKPFSQHGYVIIAPHINIIIPGLGEMSGTNLRKFIGMSTPETFKQVFGWYDPNLYDTLRQKLTENFFGSKSTLLTEGGAFGHMAHPYEDRDFTFDDLGELVDRSLSGNLNIEGDVQEKTDGQNLMVTYKDGKLGAARNKSTIIDPMDISQLASKFSGRGSIETAFVNAMQDLQTALETLGSENLTKIFKNGKRFLNIEIIFPGTKNVIDYGETAYLVLLGMVEFNDAGEPVKNLTREAAQLQGLIKKVNADQQSTFSIIAPRALTVAKSADFEEKVPYFKSKLASVAKSAGLGTSNTLGEYYRSKFSDIIDYTFNVSPEIKTILLNRWVNADKSVRLTKQLLGDQYESVVQYEKQQLSDDYKKIQWPIESIILELGVEVMSNIKDFLSVSPDKTVQDLRKDLANLIKSAKSSTDPKILKSFKSNLTKIQQLGGFSKIMPAEGIVFPFKGRLMKFTGTFAPINQLLGLFRYSR